MNPEERSFTFYKTEATVMEGLSLFHQSIAAPYHACFICEFVYGEELKTLAGIEELIYGVYETWPAERIGIYLQQVTLTLETPYVLLGFTLVFFEQRKEKQLPLFEEWLKKEVEAKNEPQQERRLRRKETQGLIKRMTDLSELVVQTHQEIEQLRAETQRQEDRWTAIYERLEEVPAMKRPSKKVDPKPTKWQLMSNERGRELAGHTFRWGKQEITKQTAKPVERFIEPLNDVLAAKVIDLFLSTEKSSKVQRVSKKQLMDWEKRMEPVSYLWTMIQLQGVDEWVIGGVLSCQELVSEFPLVLGELSESITKTSLFKYCSKQLIQQVQGYIALVDYLENLLGKLINKKEGNDDQ